MAFTRSKTDLAEILVAMPFGDLMQVAHEFVSMVAEAEPKRRISTPLGMAEMLFDWAEARIEETAAP